MPAFLWPLFLYAIILGLHMAIPGRWVVGYVTDHETGEVLRYRLNGLWVLGASVCLWMFVCSVGLIDWNDFYVHRWEMLAGAFVLGLLFTAAIVLPAPQVPRKTIWQELYEGRLPNPQFQDGMLDAKMVLYLVGAVMLELNVLSFAVHHVVTHLEDPSPGVFLYAFLFTFFVVEYLNFEEVHLYTYDFMAERVGFKLGWGCLVFYPFFYPIGLWGVAGWENPHASALWYVFAAALFFVGWMLSRGANLQKFWFKQDPFAKAFGFLEPETISGGGKHVLAGGFWGLSRHINYLGEILMATGLTLSLGYVLQIGWLYPLYYVALLLPRQADDDRRCSERYGYLWDEYCRKVPWKIIPYVY